MKDELKKIARKAYDATIGHPLASGKGRHEAAAAEGFAGSERALKTGVYTPGDMARDLARSATDTSHNIREAGRGAARPEGLKRKSRFARMK